MTAFGMTSTLTSLAQSILSRVEDRSSIPRYGSDEWDALPDQDPRRAASVIVSAECWRRHTSAEQVAADLRDELQREDDAVARRYRGASADVWQTRDWPCYPSPNAPTRAELQQRRREAA